MGFDHVGSPVFTSSYDIIVPHTLRSHTFFKYVTLSNFRKVFTVIATIPNTNTPEVK